MATDIEIEEESEAVDFEPKPAMGLEPIGSEPVQTSFGFHAYRKSDASDPSSETDHVSLCVRFRLFAGYHEDRKDGWKRDAWRIRGAVLNVVNPGFTLTLSVQEIAQRVFDATRSILGEKAGNLVSVEVIESQFVTMPSNL